MLLIAKLLYGTAVLLCENSPAVLEEARAVASHTQRVQNHALIV